MPTNELSHLIQKVAGGRHARLQDEIRTALETMTAGPATPPQMGAFLMALRVRGETVEEITGARRLMRSKMTRVEAPPDAVDIVGTGGDGHGTYNVSTCASLVAAGAGCTSPSTATAPCPPCRARPTCWRRSASSSTCRRPSSRAASSRPASASCGRRCTIRP